MAVYMLAYRSAYGKQSRDAAVCQKEMPTAIVENLPTAFHNSGRLVRRVHRLAVRVKRISKKDTDSKRLAVWFPKERPFLGREKRVKAPQLPQLYLVKKARTATFSFYSTVMITDNQRKMCLVTELNG